MSKIINLSGRRIMSRKSVQSPISIVNVMCVFLIASAMLTGCMSFRAYWDLDSDLISSSYEAADKIIAGMSPPIGPNQPILTATFVDINDLEETSAFGRTISEQIASRLTQQGHRVIEMKLRKTVFMQNSRGGQFMLSRELKHITTEHNVQYVVTGTYSVANYVIYVSANVISPSDNKILATYNYKLPRGANNRALLDRR